MISSYVSRFVSSRRQQLPTYFKKRWLLTDSIHRLNTRSTFEMNEYLVYKHWATDDDDRCRWRRRREKNLLRLNFSFIMCLMIEGKKAWAVWTVRIINKRNKNLFSSSQSSPVFTELKDQAVKVKSYTQVEARSKDDWLESGNCVFSCYIWCEMRRN